jgi:hypothetical protein
LPRQIDRDLESAIERWSRTDAAKQDVREKFSKP